MNAIEIALEHHLERFEQDRSLHEVNHLRQRVEALDALDVLLLDEQSIGVALLHRAKTVCAQLESVNSQLYERIRREIERGAGAASLTEWMPDANNAADFTNRGGYDHLDELIAGILQLEEPSARHIQLEPEMVPYQPTPARHIFDLIRRAALTDHESLVDLGSGLGQVTLIASICTNANCTGIEPERSYLECARKSAYSLNLKNAKFIQGDARAADFSQGTVFYLYTPFSGAILRNVLDSLSQQALTRKIRVCTFGPCTRAVAEEPWLSAVGALETDRIAVFSSAQTSLG